MNFQAVGALEISLHRYNCNVEVDLNGVMELNFLNWLRIATDDGIW